MNNLNGLINVYNSLTEVETKGKSTMIMSDCLRILKSIIESERNLETDGDNDE